MRRSGVRLVLLVGVEVVAVVLLHRLGSVDGLGGPGSDPAAWLRGASPEEVLGGALRLVALACASWLLGSTLLYLGARVVAGRDRLPALGALVPAFVRRQIDRALAVSLLASATLGSGGLASAAAGEPSPPATVEVRDGRAIATFPSPTPPNPEPPVIPVTAAPAPPPPAPAAPVPAGQHVVAPGESMWTIAADHAGATAAAQYWAHVVDVNRARVRSGDPDLIYPGEIVELPPR
jgi:hypothetical protein